LLSFSIATVAHLVRSIAAYLLPSRFVHCSPYVIRSVYSAVLVLHLIRLYYFLSTLPLRAARFDTIAQLSRCRFRINGHHHHHYLTSSIDADRTSKEKEKKALSAPNKRNATKRYQTNRYEAYNMKYIVVTGGVVSGLGKGVTISSMGKLLQSCGLKVTAIKIDPYLNVDAGTMSPFEHGEVFVLDDGGESDLDLGNYERFLKLRLTSDHNLTTGKIYRQVILAERRGDYLGKTVQVVPHITDAIQQWIERVAKVPVGNDDIADICLIEVGGTVGDIESSVFLEALRQFQFRVGHENFCLCFLSLVPCIQDEQKTKPTQHGVRDLRSLGLSPSVIFCRSPSPLLVSTKQKISDFCHVPADHVLSVHDVNNVYHVPGLLEGQNLHGILHRLLHLPTQTLSPDLTAWKEMAQRVETATKSVTIALIGKYTGLADSYLSVIKALRHASIQVDHQLVLEWIDASHLEGVSSSSTSGEAKAEDDAATTALKEEAWQKLKNADGVVIPGGFGARGWEGKIAAAAYCRLHDRPCLGICLGFQAMVVEYCRAVLGWADANSTEIDETTEHPVVLFMPEIDKKTMGGTMRLGARTTKFSPLPDGMASAVQSLYGGGTSILERHRHRYEVNPAHVHEIQTAGLLFVGRDETGERMEVSELPGHRYYVGCQFHPEFTSRPLCPSPPFLGLLMAATNTEPTSPEAAAAAATN
jgi:CTP synthase